MSIVTGILLLGAALVVVGVWCFCRAVSAQRDLDV